jgi:hypothetical protein
VTRPKNADGTSALLRAKKPTAAPPDFTEAQRSCRTASEREQLALVLSARWTAQELHEFARLHYFKNGKDYPTASSYRRAIGDLANHYRGFDAYSKLSDYPHKWLKLFRKGGSKPLPPRRDGLLKRVRGNGPKVTSGEYAWHGHTEEFRSLIEQQAREYFRIAPELPLHLKAWAAAHRAYEQEQAAQALAARRESELTSLILLPKSRKNSSKVRRGKLASQFDYSFIGYEKLKPHFHYDFVGHTPTFREEVTAWARKDNGLPSHAIISPKRWKVACHKHYELREASEA